ncbi:possible photosynthetic complex assembly protein [Erythrobacter sp. NAP1]|uniref:photosynthetic complex assembly protein PuhC n=1 Tax=Erythrobacter sp. NAP1 TaxID=237727 RepID=UPI0000685123|nr:photosynthetic complex assembly protein PuhC [Erythrobacter sp. NAP1]EAQ27804.1 possible photosynthetic complex assembly protein [Erythrobacter sp. NAP1]
MIVREYEDDEIVVHRVPLMMAGALIVSVLALTAGTTMGYFERQSVPSEARATSGAQPLDTRALYFFDETDGTVRVEDAETGEVIERYGPGTGGFVRTSLRSLTYQRRVNGIGREVPFDLIEWDNGELTLIDSTTDATVELGSFGPGNRETFAAMLERGS